MKLNTLHKFLLAGLVSFIVTVSIGPVVAPVSYTFYWSSDVYFGLSTYGTAINFNEAVHLGQFTFNNGTSIDFSDVYMGENNVEDLSLSTQTSNMTVTNLTNDQIDYTVTTSGTQTINMGDKEPNNVQIDGVTVIEGIGYTFSDGVVTIGTALSNVQIKFSNPAQIYIPTSRGEYTTETWYFRNDTWTVNGELGYKLYTIQSDESTYVESTSASLEDFKVGIKLYQVNTDGDLIPITDEVVAEVTQSGLTAGTMLNTTYTLSEERDLTFDDAIEVVVYHQIGSGSQTEKAQFITQNLQTDKLNDNSWTISYYVTVTENAGTYYYRFYYGDSSTDSKIVNIQYETLDPWGKSLYHLGKSDLIGFLLNPYSYYVGQEIAMGLIAMAIIIPAYNRYRDIRPVMVLCLLFGGVGGVITALIPAVAMKISFLFLAIGLAIMLYKLIR